MPADAISLFLTPVYGESGHAALPAPRSLGALVHAARRRSGSYVLTSVRHGAPDAALGRLLSALRGFGVCETPVTARTALDRTGIRLLSLQAGGGDPAAAAQPVLVVVSGASHGLLLPAVQKVREAAARLQLQPDFEVFAVATGAAAPPGGQGLWSELGF